MNSLKEEEKAKIINKFKVFSSLEIRIVSTSCCIFQHVRNTCRSSKCHNLGKRSPILCRFLMSSSEIYGLEKNIQEFGLY